MELKNCNPYIRAAEIQGAILEGNEPRKAYDHRLFYILQNEGFLIMDGIRYPLVPHTLILLPPSAAYYFEGKLRVVVINFDLTRQCCHRTEPICPPPVSEFRPELQFDTTSLPLPCVPYLVKGNPYLQSCVVRIVEEFRSLQGYADALTSGLLKALLAELLEDNRTAEQALCQRIDTFIRTHAGQITHNCQIADAFGYHEVYLGELYRKINGRTLHQAVIEERIAQACRWLERTDSSVSEIAEACGFCSRTHFCTVFKRVMGISPTAHRSGVRSV